MNNTVLYPLVMLVAGLGIPIMAAFNSSLGARLGNPALATTILFTVGFMIAILYLLSSKGIPTTLFKPSIPWYLYFGGFFVMFYILSITWIAPKFGIANAVSFVLLGQLIAMSIIDHYALFGVQKFPIDAKRFIGLLFMALGVFLVVKKAA